MHASPDGSLLFCGARAQIEERRTELGWPDFPSKQPYGAPVVRVMLASGAASAGGGPGLGVDGAGRGALAAPARARAGARPGANGREGALG